MCNRLYALRRYVECLRAVLNFLQWHARAAGAATASDTIEPMDDAELADLAMRASRRCETTSAIQAGAQVARASRRMVRCILPSRTSAHLLTVDLAPRPRSQCCRLLRKGRTVERCVASSFVESRRLTHA
jgi:hypothetical protein